MHGKCCVPNCRTNTEFEYNSDDVIIFHKIPLDKKTEWIKLLKLKNDIPPSWRVCSIHFKDSDYCKTASIKKFLKPNVIPSENLPNNFENVNTVKPQTIIYEKKMYLCNWNGCTKIVQDLKRHRNTHLKNYTCNKCNFVTSRRIFLKDHLNKKECFKKIDRVSKII